MNGLWASPLNLPIGSRATSRRSGYDLSKRFPTSAYSSKTWTQTGTSESKQNTPSLTSSEKKINRNFGK